MPNLTDLSVQKFPEGVYFDAKTPGFGIRVGKNRKTWLVVKGERRTKIRLGHYPAMTLSEARKRALVTLGSPMQEKPLISFPDALEAFLALPRWRPRSKIVLTSSLRHFTWKRNLDKITHEDVVTALEEINAPSARAHAFKDIRTFFNWTVPRYLSQSPCVGIKMPSQPSRDRILTQAELKAVWKTAGELGTYGNIVRLLILTGQRRTEIASLKAEWITDDIITLPPSITKNKREHTFPIGEFTRSFLGHKNTPFDWQRQKKKLDKTSGVTAFTLHDLRRTMASLHAEIGTPIHITERLLNHVSGTQAGIVSVYQRYNYLPEQKLAVDNYEQFLKKLVS